MTITREQLEDLASTAIADAREIPEGEVSDELRDGLKLLCYACRAVAGQMEADEVTTVHSGGSYPTAEERARAS